jgi:hypothetical protein|tara:strand:+ start:72 stop:362 length:291 start_codon:yes stop_codon:yes gene_type:complete
MLVGASTMEVGNVLVTTTKNKGHSVEFWAESAANKIVSVGGNCHPLIAQQAEAFKEDVKNVVAFYLAEAVKSDRTTLIAELENQGHKDMADILRRL